MELIDRFREAVKIKTDWPEGALAGNAEAEGWSAVLSGLI
jgi:hypothetical protein